MSDAPQDADPREKIRLRLCDDNGWVSHDPIKEDALVETTDKCYLDRLNRLRRSGVHVKPFPCTGTAHLAGEVFSCTSPAHIGVGMAYAEMARTIPHHVKAGNASLPPFGVVGPVSADDFWKDVQEMATQEPVTSYKGIPVFESIELKVGSVRFAPPLGPDTPVPVTQLHDGTVRLDVTPAELYAAAQREPVPPQLTPAEAEAMTTFTWGPGSHWGKPSRFFPTYDGYVAARKSGYAKLRAIALGTVKPFGYWKGEPLLSRFPGEESVVLASLSDDVERIKACREPKKT